ncbi:hypothetical protein diail_4807 [Diaporthe ilicicola]|nr:hypothetical protein diail_4807 [Diaporthe ilicicola]
MGCMSHRRPNAHVRPEQKWDYIQLNDFKSGNAFTYIAYGYLYFSLILSLAVYTVDTFTAVNLLAFNKWSSEIQPAVSFDVTKWIFSICIILSFVNVGYEHIRAQRIMRRGAVAESYLDNLAVRLESVRMGKGKGWRRFLVFAELTKSKKGAEYIALFTYFSFQSWIRVIFCSGPRQAVNAITLYSVYTAKLSIEGDNFEHSLENFFAKIKELAEQDVQQAVILSGMVFTLVIWAFSMLSLILAALFFVFFLWGWIPRDDGGLSGYCDRKINKRLMKIVSKKVNAAIEDQERARKKAELKAAKKAGELPPEERKATLPNLMPQKGGDDKLPDMPMLSRNDTMATLPLYTSRPGTPNGGQPALPAFELNQMRPMLSRTATSTTASSRAPLLAAGAEMGRASPALRSPMGGPPPLARVQTNQSSFGGSYTQTPSSYSPTSNYPPMPQPIRSPTSTSVGSYGMPPRSNMTPAPRGTFDDYSMGRASPAPLRQMPSHSSFDDYNGRSSPAPSAIPPRMMPGMMPGYGQGGYPGGGPPAGYPAGYPARSATGPVPNRVPMAQPQRNMTAPVQAGIRRQGTGEFRSHTPAHSEAGSGYFNPSAPADARDYQRPPSDEYPYRPGTAHSQRSINSQPQRPMNGPPQHNRQPTNGSGWGTDLEGQRGTPGPRY